MEMWGILQEKSLFQRRSASENSCHFNGDELPSCTASYEHCHIAQDYTPQHTTSQSVSSSSGFWSHTSELNHTPPLCMQTTNTHITWSITQCCFLLMYALFLMYANLIHDLVSGFRFLCSLFADHLTWPVVWFLLLCLLCNFFNFASRFGFVSLSALNKAYFATSSVSAAWQ